MTNLIPTFSGGDRLRASFLEGKTRMGDRVDAQIFSWLKNLTVNERISVLCARLTRRQLEILVLLGEGLPNTRIASDLNLSKNTVKMHVAEILKRLQLKSRTQAAFLVARASTELRALRGKRNRSRSLTGR